MPPRASKKAASQHRRGPARVGRSNIRDVARVAEVSVATVSRVMAGSDVVAESTRQKVLAAVEELGFVVNGHARALGGRGTPMIALVVHEVFGPSFSVLARGAENLATELGHLFVVSTTHEEPDREQRVVSMLQQQRPAAVLWLGPLDDDPEQEERVAQYSKVLAEVGSRLVVCGRPPLDNAPDIACVEYDNIGGARAMTEHLIELGHRKILFVGGRAGHLSSQRRLAGYQEAMQAAGLRVPRNFTPEGDFTADSGRRAVRQALEQGIRFTAVAAVVDSVAIGVMHELNNAGLKVPDDVSVTGFDDVDVLPGLDLGLTTAHVPFEEVGRTAAQQALSPTVHHTKLPVTVRIRTTTARPATRRRATPKP